MVQQHEEEKLLKAASKARGRSAPVYSNIPELLGHPPANVRLPGGDKTTPPEYVDNINDPNLMLLRLMLRGKVSEGDLKAWDAM